MAGAKAPRFHEFRRTDPTSDEHRPTIPAQNFEGWRGLRLSFDVCRRLFLGRHPSTHSELESAVERFPAVCLREDLALDRVATACLSLVGPPDGRVLQSPTGHLFSKFFRTLTHAWIGGQMPLEMTIIVRQFADLFVVENNTLIRKIFETHMKKS
jgi:hypothetical protein